MGRIISISFSLLLLCAIAVADSYNVNRHGRQILEEHIESTTTVESSTVVHNHTRPTLTNVSSSESSETTTAPSHLHQTAADVAIAIIIIIVITVILGMGIYFIRKFEQLNKMVPTYRYSSLKTEVNGIDDKIETQYLVNASTEEEDFEEEVTSLPTLIIHSQTTLSSSKADNSVSVLPLNKVTTGVNASDIKQMIATDSDDELLQ